MLSVLQHCKIAKELLAKLISVRVSVQIPVCRPSESDVQASKLSVV